MGVKKANVYPVQWVNSSPIPFVANAPMSGVTQGVMSGTSTIYSPIMDLLNYDNIGVEISWSGNPNGNISYYGSNSGSNFFPVSLVTSQPSGSAATFGINMNQWPYRFLLIEYTNVSGAGLLSTTLFYKDLN